MQRHQGDLDAKAQQDRHQQNDLTAHGQAIREDRGDAEVDTAGEQGQAQEGPQDQHPGDGRKDQELRGGIGLVGAPPNRDEEPERDQLELIEEEEEQQVVGDEGAIYGTADQQQHREVDPRPSIDIAGDDRRNQSQGGIDQHQRQGEAVDPEGIIQTDARQPAVEFLQLHPGNAGIELDGDHQAGQQLDHKDGDRDQAQPS